MIYFSRDDPKISELTKTFKIGQWIDKKPIQSMLKFGKFWVDIFQDSLSVLSPLDSIASMIRKRDKSDDRSVKMTILLILINTFCLKNLISNKTDIVSHCESVRSI